MFRLLLLGKGSAGCVKIWNAVGVPLVAVYAVASIQRSIMCQSAFIYVSPIPL